MNKYARKLQRLVGGEVRPEDKASLEESMAGMSLKSPEETSPRSPSLEESMSLQSPESGSAQASPKAAQPAPQRDLDKFVASMKNWPMYMAFGQRDRIKEDIRNIGVDKVTRVLENNENLYTAAQVLGLDVPVTVESLGEFLNESKDMMGAVKETLTSAAKTDSEVSDVEEAQAAVKAAKARVKQAGAELKSAKNDLAKAEKELKRQKGEADQARRKAKTSLDKAKEAKEAKGKKKSTPKSPKSPKKASKKK